MKLIPLSKNKFAKVDDWRYDELNQHKWYFDGKYARRNIYENGKLIRRELMHRVVAGTKDEEFTDHWNLDKLDNQEVNLRTATKQQNAANTRKQADRSSIYKGVSKSKNGWRTQIWFNNQKHYDASFSQERWAAMAHDLNASVLFGEYVRLNFPEAILAFQE
jgi:hypothetical protein